MARSMCVDERRPLYNTFKELQSLRGARRVKILTIIYLSQDCFVFTIFPNSSSIFPRGSRVCELTGCDPCITESSSVSTLPVIFQKWARNGEHRPHALTVGYKLADPLGDLERGSFLGQGHFFVGG